MDSPKKILLIQLKRAGDVLLATPAAALLKRRWPQARIDFLVDPGFAPMLENNPAIDTIQRYDRNQILSTLKRIRAERYDHIFDFQSSPRSAVVSLTSGARHTAGYQVPFWGRFYRQTIRRPGSGLTVVQGKVSLVEAVLGPLGDVPEPQIVLRPEENQWGQRTLGPSKGRGMIGMIPTHRRESRRWHAESFSALAGLLHQAGYSVWLFWGPGERAYVESISDHAAQAQVTPATSLREMAALLARCDLVVSNDNGPMHIAAAVGVPTVTIYGPTDPHAWNPGGPRHRVLQADGLSCLGCNLNECPFGHECMTGVTPERVLAACEDLLSRSQKAVLV